MFPGSANAARARGDRSRGQPAEHWPEPRGSPSRRGPARPQPAPAVTLPVTPGNPARPRPARPGPTHYTSDLMPLSGAWCLMPAFPAYVTGPHLFPILAVNATVAADRRPEHDRRRTTLGSGSFDVIPIFLTDKKGQFCPCFLGFYNIPIYL